MNGKPLMIDGFCGLGGASEGFLAEGWECVGLDNELHDYGYGRYPGHLILCDILQVHGSQFKDADFLWFSPPCQEYSYMAMPWSRAKKIRAEYLSGVRDVKKLTALFDACFRIQREAIEAAGHFIPLVVENVRGAQKWVGRSRWNFGSFHLWGDVPALMPMTKAAVKTPGRSMSRDAEKKWGTHNMGSADKIHAELAEAVKIGGDWFDDRTPGCHAMCGSKSKARKAASATIAKIPFALASHIARVYKPMECAA